MSDKSQDEPNKDAPPALKKLKDMKLEDVLEPFGEELGDEEPVFTLSDSWRD